MYQLFYDGEAEPKKIKGLSLDRKKLSLSEQREIESLGTMLFLLLLHNLAPWQRLCKGRPCQRFNSGPQRRAPTACDKDRLLAGSVLSLRVAPSSTPKKKNADDDP